MVPARRLATGACWPAYQGVRRVTNPPRLANLPQLANLPHSDLPNSRSWEN
jgi:hypothetical protein